MHRDRLGRTSVYRESHTKEGLPVSANRYSKLKSTDQANAVRYTTKAKRCMQINLADSQGNDE